MPTVEPKAHGKILLSLAFTLNNPAFRKARDSSTFQKTKFVFDEGKASFSVGGYARFQTGGSGSDPEKTCFFPNPLG